jgi:hypothetical protein
LIGELAVSAMAILTFWLLIRHFWATRRQPIRGHAPTGAEPWVTPTPRHRWSDDTPR